MLLVLLGEMVLLSLVVVAIARRLPLRWPWLAGALVLATPTLLGHSFTNTKDVPFALFSSAYTLGLIQRAPLPLERRGAFPPARPARTRFAAHRGVGRSRRLDRDGDPATPEHPTRWIVRKS
jgi:hypothetical protein